jgi:amino acid transporter
LSTSSEGNPIFVRQATGLVRQISGLEALGMSINQMGLLYVFNVVAFTPAFYPSANPLLGPVVGLLLVLPIVGIYILFSIGIPRTGGDYVWVSRVFNPGIGFSTNFAFTLIVLSVIGSVAPWIGEWSIGPMFYDLGQLYNNANYISIANALQTQNNAFIVSAIFIIIAGLIVIASSKLAATIVKYWTFVAMIIAVIFIAVVLSAGSTTFANNFNTFSGSNMSYNQVISTGQAQYTTVYNGVPPAFSSATLYAAALGLLGYLGFNASAYFAGEVKQNRKSQILAQLGGTVIYAALITIIIAVEYFGEGPKFVNSLAAMWYNGFGNYPYIPGVPPLASALSMYWTRNAGLVSLFNLSFGLTAEMMNISILFMLSRNLFAWSFDRVVPATFADINPRTRTPIYAVAVMTVVGLVYTGIFIYATGILSGLFNYGTAGEFTVFLIVSLAAIAYPYRKKDVFDASDSLAKKKIGSVPLITILGGISFVVCLVTIYAILLPQIGGSAFFSNFFYGIVFTFLIGAVIYFIAWGARRSQGIDLSLLQREIPPE